MIKSKEVSDSFADFDQQLTSNPWVLKAAVYFKDQILSDD
jgi:hypothetical protein